MSHPMIDGLRADHERFSRLLEYLSAELARWKGGGDPDLRRLHDALEYLDDYANGFHHPREDALLERLGDQALENQPVLEAVRREHHQLEARTRELRGDLEAALVDSVVPADRVRDNLEAFVEAQRAHLEAEERHVFPVIERALTAEDWSAAAARLPDRDDPMFGRAGERYRALYERILAP